MSYAHKYDDFEFRASAEKFSAACDCVKYLCCNWTVDLSDFRLSSNRIHKEDWS